MPDTTPNTEQNTVSTPPVVEETAAVTPAPEPKKEEKKEKFSLVGGNTEQDNEYEQESSEEGQDVPRTEFMNLKEALLIGQSQLKRIPKINPEAMRQFLANDLYPILIEIADYSNWYVGDLHNRVMGLEMNESDGYAGEALSPETAEELINFIGMSLQIFGVILQSPKADPRLIQTAQLLTTQAPGLIAKVQDITMIEEPDEDEDEEDYDDDEDEDESNSEPTKVLEPQKREPVQVAASVNDAGEQEVKGANGAGTKTGSKDEEAPAQETKSASEEPEPVSESAESPDAEVKEGKSDA